MRVILPTVFNAAILLSQSAVLQPSGVAGVPALLDGNSPGFWAGDEFRFLTSTGAEPVLLRGGDQYTLGAPVPITIEPADHYPIWIEAVWLDYDGTLFGWYHHEPAGVCGAGSLTAPEIGTVVSYDYGQTGTDMGIVLTNGHRINCAAGNGFSGGNGYFSVILDQYGEYSYFLFTNYGGPVSGQGVAIARMHYRDRWNPAGNVFKYHAGWWNEPGLGGSVTPVSPARTSWARNDTDSFWGPAIHWNTYLGEYVILMNRAGLLGPHRGAPVETGGAG